MLHLTAPMREERGQAITEFVIILPVFILLLFGMLELGRLFNAWISVTAAVREGARLAAVADCSSDVTSKVRDATGFTEANKSWVNVNCGTAPNCSGSPITAGQALCVKASYPVDIITPVISQILSRTVTVRAQATMRRE